MIVRAKPHADSVPGLKRKLKPVCGLEGIVYLVDTESVCMKEGVKAIWALRSNVDPYAGYLPLAMLDLDEAPYEGGPL